jgi:hypothetical protein
MYFKNFAMTQLQSEAMKRRRRKKRPMKPLQFFSESYRICILILNFKLFDYSHYEQLMLIHHYYVH